MREPRSAGRRRSALGRTLRLVVALVLVAGATTAGLARSGPAVADEVSAAAACDGVLVVVDARELGGSTTTRCAPGSPADGLAALEAAGHSYSFVPRVPGMVCTIDGAPDPCNGAPTDAYWSYWYAERGGSWTYASRGAGSRTPESGTVEGWAFGAGNPPGTAPPAPEPTEDEAASQDEPAGQDDAPGEDNGSGGTGGSSGSSGSNGEPSGDASSSGGSSSGGSSESGSSGGGSSGGGASGASSGSDDTDAPTDEGAETDETTDADNDAGDHDTTEEDTTEEDADATDDDEAEADEADAEDDDPARGGRDDVMTNRDDEVALARPDGDGGAGWAGVAAGTALVGGLAGAAAWQVRRRRLLEG